MVAGYFVTGATGVVGAAVVERLLRDEPGPIHVLVRAEDERALGARARSLRAHWGTPSAAERVTFHRGDVTTPDLGLSRDAKRVIARDVTRIIHAAGDVHMGRSIERARDVAVGGVERVLELGAELNALRRLEKIEIVSTVGVGGRDAAPLPEAFIARPSSFYNTYEQAKWEGEVVARRHAERGLPLTVHRPSMVVGDSRTGRSIRSQLFAAICTFLTGAPTLGVLPSLFGRHVDLVPQDFVARALVWSSRTAETAGRVLHLSSGRYESTSLVELARIARVTARRLRLRAVRPLFVDARAMRLAVETLGRWHANLRKRAALLSVLLDYLDAPKVFENEASQRLLRGAGVVLPSSERYLGRVVAAALAPSARCA